MKITTTNEVLTLSMLNRHGEMYKSEIRSTFGDEREIPFYQLRKNKLIEVEILGDDYIYRITQAGIDELSSFINELNTI